MTSYSTTACSSPKNLVLSLAMQGHLPYDMVGVGRRARSFEGLEGVHHNIDDSGPKALIADQLPLNQQLISEYCSGVFPYLWNRAFSYGYGLWIILFHTIMDRKPDVGPISNR